MNKAEFLAGLRDALAGKLPSGELEDVLSYYEEYFADAGEEHEAEAAEGLGSPASVAAQVLEGRTGQAPSAASAERRPRRLWPVVLGICAAALLLLGVGIRLVFLAQRMPDAPAAGERQPVAAGQEPAVVEQDPVSTPPENKLELEPFTALDIDVGIGDIRMEEGDGWYLSLTSGGQDGDGTPYLLNHSQRTLDLRGTSIRKLMLDMTGLQELWLGEGTEQLLFQNKGPDACTIHAPEDGSGLTLQFIGEYRPHTELPNLRGLHGIELKDFDLTELAAVHPRLKELRLWGAPGNLGNFSAVGEFRELTNLSTFDLFGFGAGDIPTP